MAAIHDSPWLILIHKLPPKPPYLRVKAWRRLQALGAVAIKNSVYVLPNTEQAREDLEWTLRSIEQDGGEGSLCEARLVDGLGDEEVRALFRSAREADYRALVGEVRALAHETLPARRKLPLAPEERARGDAGLARLRKRLAEVIEIDFFGATGREAAEGLLQGLEERLGTVDGRPSDGLRRWSRADVQRRVWVTRTGVHVDRIASSWLIRGFIDTAARLKFVPSRGYEPQPGELRFDMFDAEFTHRGDLCTFEVLLADFGLDDPALVPIAEIVHDIDLKETKFSRPERPGIDHLIAGIAMAVREDEERCRRGGETLAALYEYYRRKRSRTPWKSA